MRRSDNWWRRRDRIWMYGLLDACRLERSRHPREPLLGHGYVPLFSLPSYGLCVLISYTFILLSPLLPLRLALTSSCDRRSSSPCASSAVPPSPLLPALSPTTPGAQRRRSLRRLTRSTTRRSRTCSRSDEWNRMIIRVDGLDRDCVWVLSLCFAPLLALCGF